MGALVVLAAEAGTVDPGGVGECVVLIRNTAEEHDRFDVLVHGPAAVWATAEPSGVDVAAGDEVPVWIRFRVPRDPALRPGPVEFAVTVSSHNDPSFVHAERGEIAVGGFGRLAAALDQAVDEGRHVVVPVRLENSGNAPMQATVAVRNEPVEAKEVTVGPSGTAAIELVVRRRRGLQRVTIDVVSDTGDEVSLGAPLPDEHRSLRRDLLRSATVLGAFLVAAFIVVATIGDEEPDQPGLVAVAPSESTTTVPNPGEVATPVEQPGGETAQSTGSASPAGAKRAPTSAPADLVTIVFVRWYGPGDRDLVVRGAGRAGGELRLRSPTTIESAPDIAPDGSLIAYVQEDGGSWRLCVVAATGGDATCYTAVDPTSSTAWKPDGSAVFVVRGSELVEVPVGLDAGAAVEPIPRQVAVPAGRFSLSPDGTRVATVDGGRIVIRPLGGGDSLSLRVPGSPEDPTWTPAGDRVVYTSDTQLYSAPLGDGPIRQLTATGTVNGDAVVVGGWVVFRSNRSGTGDLYALAVDAADGTEVGLALITRAAERDTDPGA